MVVFCVSDVHALGSFNVRTSTRAHTRNLTEFEIRQYKNTRPSQSVWTTPSLGWTIKLWLWRYKKKKPRASVLDVTTFFTQVMNLNSLVESQISYRCHAWRQTNLEIIKLSAVWNHFFLKSRSKRGLSVFTHRGLAPEYLK